MKPLLFITTLVCLIAGISCQKGPDLTPEKEKDLFKIHPLKIAVVSDIHYMDPSLLKNHAAGGKAFQDYLNADPKLIEFSDPIFREVMTELKSEKPDILLIPGDLTKDGEKLSHATMAGLLRQLAASGIRVFVVPGNHDINNPEARTYTGDIATPTPSISAAEFSTLYADYGYKNAISRDPNSLSYVAQLYPGIWLLGLDDCEYELNQDIAIVAGRIKPQTMTWALARLAEAKQKHIQVFGMMHHNMIEHYAGQTQLDPGYVTDNWETEADQFMNAGMSVIFTGHYHANDITKRVTGANELIDIETGSLVTAPIPYRILNMTGNEFEISTRHVTHINAALPDGLNFPDYANSFLSQHLDGYFSYYLSQVFGVPDQYITEGAPLFRNAIMAHFAGDENISPEESARDDAFGALSPDIAGALHSLWTDINTSDNNLSISFPGP